MEAKPKSAPHHLPFPKDGTDPPAVCGAKTRGGTPCQRAPDLNGRCNLHGGKSLCGIGSKRFKHGRYSKYLPTGTLSKQGQSGPEAYHALANFTSLRDDIAVLDARTCDLLLRVDSGESSARWQVLNIAAERVKQAQRRFASAKQSRSRLRWQHEVDEAWDDLCAMIDEPVSDRDAWRDVLDNQEVKRRLVDTEAKWDKARHECMSMEQFMILIDAVMQALDRHVTDPEARQALTREMSRFLGRKE